MASEKVRDGDDRFLRVKKDPRFWEMPERERKIKIDKRFRSMFHDERFKLKYTVDKRGRPVDHSSAEDLKRFYQLSDSELSESEKEQEDDKQKKKKTKKKTKSSAVPEDEPHPREEAKEEVELSPGEKSKRSCGEGGEVKGFHGLKVHEEGREEEVEEESHCQGDEEASDSGAGLSELDESDGDDESEDVDEESTEDSEEEDGDSGPDLARGKGNIETSSDEEDEEDEVDRLLRKEEKEIEHDWGEMWKDAPRNDSVSRRLAVCSMNWDRLKAKDLLALLSSFKPKGGLVLSVKIYPSEFGKERLRMEQAQGPLELVKLPEDPEQDTEDERVYREKMRDYQIKRMRYYYAVVECDSPETAARIYEECDGYEYESSSSILDLRFIPDDVTFDDEPKDVAVDVDLVTYTPNFFTSTALGTSKVELTWDETDHERVTAMSRKFKKDEILDMDFQAYLASSSEDDEEELEAEDEEGDEKSVEETKKVPKNDAEQLAKYRELLKGIQEKDQKAEDKAMEMEVTWVPDVRNPFPQAAPQTDSWLSVAGRIGAAIPRLGPPTDRSRSPVTLQRIAYVSERQFDTRETRALRAVLRQRASMVVRRDESGAPDPQRGSIAIQIIRLLPAVFSRGLKETAEQLVKKKLEDKAPLTPWEQFLQKKKEKKKQKKVKAKQQAAAESNLSDDELPPDVDLNDPYFAEELGKSGAALTAKAKSKKGKKVAEEQRTPEEEAELERHRAEMALLMDDDEDDDDNRKHFNYDKIVEHQNLSKKKKKKLMKKNELLEEDDFQVDLKDPRFQAMFTSHLYNLDPSDPSYKKTKATQSILEEKQRRREEQQRHQEEAIKRKLQETDQEADAKEKPAEHKKAMDPGLSMLIKSVKNKTEQFQARKKQKTK
ncbi:ESF1 protein-like [Scleropages formosus]|uniref:ESF1 protein-like n=1 Tax=Scleropages formosus TaxID=113540 RepID=A0A0P7V546_SCLFO|nr:ESF1 protein-like [Scleropages formosus]